MGKKILTFFGGLLISIIGYNQGIEELAAAFQKNQDSFTGIKEVISKYKKSSPLSIGIFEDRYTYFDLHHLQARVRLAETDKNHDGIDQSFHFECYAYNDKVLFLDLTEFFHISDRSDRQLIHRVDSLYAKNLVASFNKIQNKNYRWQDQFQDTPYDIFGIEWGLKITLTPEVYDGMTDIFQAVLDNDLNRIIQFSNSRCAELKAYAAIGLYLFRKLDQLQGESLQTLFEDLTNSSEKIHFAPGGCMIFSGIEIKNAISNEFLDEVYSSFLYYKTKHRQ